MPYAILARWKTALTIARKHPGRPRYFELTLLTMALICHTDGANAASSPGSSEPGSETKSLSVGAHRHAGEIVPAGRVAEVAQWVAERHDNGALPYLIIDKINAQVFVFDAVGHFQSSSPALLGLARGDRSVDGLGDKKMEAIKPGERITPAGRFLASLGRDTHGKELLWIDYKNAIALHPVVKGTAQERRAERLASPTAADHRISYGCINVPLKFYETFVSAVFRYSSGLVYILPENSSVSEFFGFKKTISGARHEAPANPASAR